MDILKKTSLIFAGVIGILLILSSFISYYLYIDRFRKLENELMLSNIEKVKNHINNEVKNLAIINYDWAARDDTYEFIEDTNQDYIESNITVSTFEPLNLNLLIFVNTSGEIVFEEGFDLINEEEVLVSDEFHEHIFKESLLVNHPDTESRIEGILLLSEAPMLISSIPIINSDAEGPIRGSLLMGRYLDNREISNLSEYFNLSLSIVGSEIFNEIRKDYTPVKVIDSSSISGYVAIEDIYGNNNLILKIDTNRDVFRQGRYTIISNLLLSAILIISFYFLTNMAHFLLRFYRLDQIYHPLTFYHSTY